MLLSQVPLAATVAGGRSRVGGRVVVVVVSAAAGRDQCERRHQREQEHEHQSTLRRFGGLVRKSSHDFPPRWLNPAPLIGGA